MKAIDYTGVLSTQIESGKIYTLDYVGSGIVLDGGVVSKDPKLVSHPDKIKLQIVKVDDRTIRLTVLNSELLGWMKASFPIQCTGSQYSGSQSNQMKYKIRPELKENLLIPHF